MKQKKLEISFMNVILCMLVIFIHVSSVPVTSYIKSSWQYAAVMIPQRLSSFAVQGFIFLSGLKLFINKADSINYKKFYFQRFKNILMPYVLWVVIYYFYFLKIGYINFSVKSLIRYIFVGELVSHFYFIIIIVQFYLLVPLWMALIKKASPSIVLLISLLITIISKEAFPDILNMLFPGYKPVFIGNAFTTFLIYWVAGCYVGLNYERFKEIIRKKIKPISILFAVISLCEAVFCYISFTGIRYIGWLENLHALYCISAILFLYTICLYISERCKSVNPIIYKTDEASYLIYLSHILLIFVVNGALSRLNITSITVGYLIRIAVTYSLSITCCILWKSLRARLSGNNPKTKGTLYKAD